MKRTALRRRLRERFFELNAELCTRAFGNLKPGERYPAWKTDDGRELCRKLRRSIGYKSTTDNGQIFYTACRQWEDIQKLKIQ